MAKLKDSTKMVIKFLQEHASIDMTSAEVAEALDVSKRSIDGVFTSAIQRKGLGYREETEIELADGTHSKVKLLRLNDAGLAFDVDAADVE